MIQIVSSIPPVKQIGWCVNIHTETAEHMCANILSIFLEVVANEHQLEIPTHSPRIHPECPNHGSSIAFSGSGNRAKIITVFWVRDFDGTLNKYVPSEVGTGVVKGHWSKAWTPVAPLAEKERCSLCHLTLYCAYYLQEKHLPRKRKISSVLATSK